MHTTADRRKYKQAKRGRQAIFVCGVGDYGAPKSNISDLDHFGFHF